MKLDSGATFYPSSITQDSSLKSVHYNVNHVENGTIKAGNELQRESRHEIATFTQTGLLERDTDQLPSPKCEENGSAHASGLHTNMASEDTDCGAANGTENFVAAYYNPFETPYTNPFEDDTYFYTDKSVTDIDLPELTSSYKDSSYYLVKDICVDMGIPSLDKILEENYDMDQKGVISLPYLDLGEKGDLKEEVASPTTPVSNGFDALLFDRTPCPGEDEVAADKGNPEKPLMKGGDIGDPRDEASSKVHDEKVVSENLQLIGSSEPILDVLKPSISGSQNPRILPGDDSDVDLVYRNEKSFSDEEVLAETLQSLHQSGAGNLHADSPSSDDEDELLSAQDYAQNTSDGVAEKPKDASEDADVSRAMAPPATTVPSSSNNANDFPFDRTVESGSITFNFDSAPPLMSSNRVSPGSVDFQQLVTGLDDSLLDSLTGSTRSFFIQHGLESSISGPIPYSGNISLRSDSSTASTRSFAFPVLHSEWNSSPVKMAKPDRRQLRKHQGWRAIFLCCRF